jgi:putative oxidoreductase
MFRKLLETPNDITATLARIALAGVIFPHGAQKLLGWFGGHGFAGTMGFFTGAMGLPWAVALLVIAIEFFGAVLLAVGLLGRVGALGVAAVMAGAVATVHHKFGFFMNWNGDQAGEGFEYHLLAVALALVVIVRGSGAFSLDRLLAGRRTDLRDDQLPAAAPAAA